MIRARQPQQHVAQRAFAGAAVGQQRHALASCDVNVHVAEQLLAAVALGQATVLQQPVAGGRVGLFAQVLLRDQQIMMLEEPVSALDLQHQLQLMEHLLHQTRAKNWVSLVVLHDLNLAAQFADHLIVLAGGTLQASA